MVGGSTVPRIGIAGYGFVGRSLSQLQHMYDVEVYDPFVEGFDCNLSAFEADIVFVCVPTPPAANGELDTSIVELASSKWKELRSDNSILVIKSTIPIGTIDRLSKELETENIVHNPEFLTERTAMHDFMNPDEVIVGGEPTAANTVLDMYRKFYDKDTIQYYAVPAKDAEMIKMTRNSFYALKVSFFNEVYELCKAIGTDYDEFKNLFTLGGRHPWIGNQHVNVPGPDGKFGFGGKCLPKDSKGLLKVAEKHGIVMETLQAAVASNKKRRGE